MRNPAGPGMIRLASLPANMQRIRRSKNVTEACRASIFSSIQSVCFEGQVSQVASTLLAFSRATFCACLRFRWVRQCCPSSPFAPAAFDLEGLIAAKMTHTCMHAYTTLPYLTLHCITLHYIALHCITLHYIALHCITLHYIALHYVALRCITLHTHTYIYTYLLEYPSTTQISFCWSSQA